jgi:alkylation response protein AidB-like acyl-CoA dehydrogenase
VNFDPDADQELIAATARAFADRELAPRAVDRDRSHTFPEAELRRLGELGMLGMTVPAALGGSEAGPMALAMVIAEIARGDASVAVTLSVTNMVAEILARSATLEAQRAHLPRLCSGEAIAGAFALSEPQAGSDPRAMTTTVERGAGGGYRLTGNKLWTTSGDRAGVLTMVPRWEGQVFPRSCWPRRRPGCPAASASRSWASAGRRRWRWCWRTWRSPRTGCSRPRATG